MQQGIPSCSNLSNALSGRTVVAQELQHGSIPDFVLVMKSDLNILYRFARSILKNKSNPQVEKSRINCGYPACATTIAGMSICTRPKWLCDGDIQRGSEMVRVFPWAHCIQMIDTYLAALNISRVCNALTRICVVSNMMKLKTTHIFKVMSIRPHCTWIAEIMPWKHVPSSATSCPL